MSEKYDTSQTLFFIVFDNVILIVFDNISTNNRKTFIFLHSFYINYANRIHTENIFNPLATSDTLSCR